MKNITYLIGVLFTAILLFSCTKEDVNLKTDNLKVMENQVFYTGSSVVLTFQNWTKKESIAWQVSPKENISIRDSADVATILFRTPGDYIVTAQSGAIIQTLTITVTDPFKPFVNETLTITPVLYDSLDRLGIAFITETTTTYACLEDYIVAEKSIKEELLHINFLGVMTSNNCTETAGKINFNLHFVPLKPKDYPIEINLEGKKYTGKFKYDGLNSQIDWEYKSGVLFNKLTVFQIK